MSARATIRPGVRVRVFGACIVCPFVREGVAPTLERGRLANLVARPCSCSDPGTRFASYSGRRRRGSARSTFNDMSRVGSLLRRSAFDTPIVLAALEIALEVALRDDPSEPTTTPW